MPKFEQARKINIKNLCGKIAQPEADEKTVICVIYGVADSHKIESTEHGPLPSFGGMFRGVSTDGKLLESNKMTLPEDAAKKIEAVLKKHVNASFAFEFAVVSSGSGWTLETIPVQPPTAFDPLASLTPYGEKFLKK